MTARFAMLAAIAITTRGGIRSLIDVQGADRWVPNFTLWRIKVLGGLIP